MNDYFSPDKPLQNPEKDADAFQHASFARQLAKSITEMKQPEGFVIGLSGQWGTGKSTILNFIQYYLKENKEIEIIKFNPWWFSGQDNLLEAFFTKIGTDLATRSDKFFNFLRDFLDSTKDLLKTATPIPGSFVDKVLQAKTLEEIRRKLIERLKDYDKRLLIVIDDVDRLQPEEIRQLFTVIKAVADLPNSIYLIAFDHDVVTKALDSVGVGTGTAYIKKIVQILIELPVLDQNQIYKLFYDKLSRIVKSDQIPHYQLSDNFETNPTSDAIYQAFFNHVIKSPRDVLQITNSIYVTYPAIKGKVNLRDLIILELIRFNQRNIYDDIRFNKDSYLQGLYASRIPESPQICRSAVTLLFPNKRDVTLTFDYDRAVRNKRICTVEHFDTYFQFIPSQKAELSYLFDELISLDNEIEIADRIKAILKHSPSSVCSLFQMIHKNLATLSSDWQIQITNVLMEIGDATLYADPTDDKFWQPFDPCKVSITNIIIDTLTRLDSSTREKALSDFFTNGRSTIILMNLLIVIEHEFGRFSSTYTLVEKDRLVTNNMLGDLEKLAVSRITDFIKSQNFLNNNVIDIRTALHILYELEPSELRTLLSDFVNNPDQLVKLLPVLAHLADINISDEVKPIYEIPTYLRDSIDLDTVVTKMQELSNHVQLTVDQEKFVHHFISAV